MTKQNDPQEYCGACPTKQRKLELELAIIEKALGLAVRQENCPLDFPAGEMEEYIKDTCDYDYGLYICTKKKEVCWRNYYLALAKKQLAEEQGGKSG